MINDNSLILNKSHRYSNVKKFKSHNPDITKLTLCWVLNCVLLRLSFLMCSLSHKACIINYSVIFAYVLYYNCCNTFKNYFTMFLRFPKKKLNSFQSLRLKLSHLKRLTPHFISHSQLELKKKSQIHFFSHFT